MTWRKAKEKGEELFQANCNLVFYKASKRSLYDCKELQLEVADYKPHRFWSKGAIRPGQTVKQIMIRPSLRQCGKRRRKQRPAKMSFSRFREIYSDGSKPLSWSGQVQEPYLDDSSEWVSANSLAGCSPGVPCSASPAGLVLQQREAVRPAKCSERQLLNYTTVSKKGAAHSPISTSLSTFRSPSIRIFNELQQENQMLRILLSSCLSCP